MPPRTRNQASRRKSAPAASQSTQLGELELTRLDTPEPDSPSGRDQVVSDKPTKQAKATLSRSSQNDEYDDGLSDPDFLELQTPQDAEGRTKSGNDSAPSRMAWSECESLATSRRSTPVANGEAPRFNDVWDFDFNSPGGSVNDLNNPLLCTSPERNPELPDTVPLPQQPHFGDLLQTPGQTRGRYFNSSETATTNRRSTVAAMTPQARWGFFDEASSMGIVSPTQPDPDLPETVPLSLLPVLSPTPAPLGRAVLENGITLDAENVAGIQPPPDVYATLLRGTSNQAAKASAVVVSAKEAPGTSKARHSSLYEEIPSPSGNITRAFPKPKSKSMSKPGMLDLEVPTSPLEAIESPSRAENVANQGSKRRQKAKAPLRFDEATQQIINDPPPKKVSPDRMPIATALGAKLPSNILTGRAKEKIGGKAVRAKATKARNGKATAKPSPDKVSPTTNLPRPKEVVKQNSTSRAIDVDHIKGLQELPRPMAVSKVDSKKQDANVGKQLQTSPNIIPPIPPVPLGNGRGTTSTKANGLSGPTLPLPALAGEQGQPSVCASVVVNISSEDNGQPKKKPSATAKGKKPNPRKPRRPSPVKTSGVSKPHVTKHKVTPTGIQLGEDVHGANESSPSESATRPVVTRSRAKAQPEKAGEECTSGPLNSSPEVQGESADLSYCSSNEEASGNDVSRLESSRLPPTELVNGTSTKKAVDLPAQQRKSTPFRQEKGKSEQHVKQQNAKGKKRHYSVSDRGSPQLSEETSSELPGLRALGGKILPATCEAKPLIRKRLIEEIDARIIEASSPPGYRSKKAKTLTTTTLGDNLVEEETPELSDASDSDTSTSEVTEVTIIRKRIPNHGDDVFYSPRLDRSEHVLGKQLLANFHVKAAPRKGHNEQQTLKQRMVHKRIDEKSAAYKTQLMEQIGRVLNNIVAHMESKEKALEDVTTTFEQKTTRSVEKIERRFSSERKTIVKKSEKDCRKFVRGMHKAGQSLEVGTKEREATARALEKISAEKQEKCQQATKNMLALQKQLLA